MSSSGRPKNKNFQELGFQLTKINGKFVAYCDVCNKNLQNTAATRLKGHRNICKLPENQQEPITTDESTITSQSSMIIILDDVENRQNLESFRVMADQSMSATVAPQNSQDLVVLDDQFMDVVTSDNFLISDESTVSSQTSSIGSSFSLPSRPKSSIRGYDIRPSTSSSCHSASSFLTSISPSSATIAKINQKRTTTKKPNSVSSYIDKISNKEEIELNEALANLVFGCNLPLRVIESKYFKNFIHKIRPAYAPKLPGRKALSTTLLDKAYDKCISYANCFIGKESVLLIDGWKNSSSNSKLVVAMIHNANKEQAFLQAWDLTGISETGEKLAEIVFESMDIANTLYNTKIYATVSDNASAMMKMGKLTSHVIWHSTCSSHTANLLAKDVLNDHLTENISIVLREFKQPDFERRIIENGGVKIKLPCETRWCSYRDSYSCYVKNLEQMKQITADPKLKRVKQNVAKLIFDDEILELVKKNIKMLDPICQLINIAQSTSCSIADAADLWLDLNVPDEFKTSLEMRRNMALNVYALTAFYLHPHKDHAKLGQNHQDQINNFLIKNLSGEGLEDWDSYRSQTFFFKTLFEKKIKNPLVFWNMAEMKHENLSKLAIRLLKMPASSAQIERLFSSWAHVHSPIRNRLTFERSKAAVICFICSRFFYIARI